MYFLLGSLYQVVLFHQISAKKSNFSKNCFLCVYMQSLIQIPLKQLDFSDIFAFSSYYCFSDRMSLKIYLTTPIATGLLSAFGPHQTLNLPGLRNFSSIVNLGSIKPFLSVHATWKTNQQRCLTSTKNQKKGKVDERFHTTKRVRQFYQNKGSLELIILIVLRNLIKVEKKQISLHWNILLKVKIFAKIIEISITIKKI